MATLAVAGTAANWRANDSAKILINKIDLTGVATGDVLQAIYVPAGTYVRNVFVKVDTPTGLTSTATVGHGGAASSWDAEVDLNATADTITFGINGTDTFVLNDGGKYYSAADTIDLTCTITSGPCTTGQITVWADCVDLSQDLGVTEAT